MTTEHKALPFDQALEILISKLEVNSIVGEDTVIVETQDNKTAISTFAFVHGMTPESLENVIYKEIDRQESEPTIHDDYNEMLIEREQEEFAKSGD